MTTSETSIINSISGKHVKPLNRGNSLEISNVCHKTDIPLTSIDHPENLINCSESTSAFKKVIIEIK